MIWFKACSRCGGDLYSNRDIYGEYTACVQCGYYLTEVEEVGLRYASRYRAKQKAVAKTRDAVAVAEAV